MESNRFLDFLSRNWYIVLIVAFILYLPFQPEQETLNYERSKRIILVDRNGHNFEYVKKDDSRISSIWENGNTFIINNSTDNVYLEEIIYSSTSSNYNSSATKYTIRPDSIFATRKKISYIFTNPPSTISVYSGGSTSRWHLHNNYY